MQNKNEGGKRSNFGLLIGLLTIAFVVLKLCNVIKWSWWWVLSPLWICAIFILVVGTLIGIINANIKSRERKDIQARVDRLKILMEKDKNK